MVGWGKLTNANCDQTTKWKYPNLPTTNDRFWGGGELPNANCDQTTKWKYSKLPTTNDQFWGGEVNYQMQIVTKLPNENIQNYQQQMINSGGGGKLPNANCDPTKVAQNDLEWAILPELATLSHSEPLWWGHNNILYFSFEETSQTDAGRNSTTQFIKAIIGQPARRNPTTCCSDWHNWIDIKTYLFSAYKGNSRQNYTTRCFWDYSIISLVI